MKGRRAIASPALDDIERIVFDLHARRTSRGAVLTLLRAWRRNNDPAVLDRALHALSRLDLIEARGLGEVAAWLATTDYLQALGELARPVRMGRAA